MNDLRVREAAPQDWRGRLLRDSRADSGAYNSYYDERPPRRSGNAGANPGRRPSQRPAYQDEAPQPPRRSGAGSGVNGPPRGPLGSSSRWQEPDDDEWTARPAQRPARVPKGSRQPEPGSRQSRPRQAPRQRKRPLTPIEKRNRLYRYASLVGVICFASLGGASFSFNLALVGILCLVFCLPCAAFFLYF